MNDFDTPDTSPGYCPVCAKKADIWDKLNRVWHCQQCNWSGVHTSGNPFYLVPTDDNWRK